MRPRALWKIRPDDPRTSLGWLWYDRSRHLESLKSGLSSGCGGVGALQCIHGHWLVGLAVIGASYVIPLIPARRRSVDALRTSPSPGPCFDATVEITRDGRALGIDRGVLTFVDGWLHFEGLRAAFALSSRDVARRQQNVLELYEGGGVTLFPDEDNKVFGGLLDAWYRLDPAAQGESVLPPSTLHATGRARARMTVFIAGPLALLCLAGASLTVRFGLSDGLLFTVASVLGGGAVLFGRSAIRASRFAFSSRPALPNETPRPLGPP